MFFNIFDRPRDYKEKDMLIDDILSDSKEIEQKGHKLKDAVVFRINENNSSYVKGLYLDQGYFEVLPQKLPFTNVVIHFNDGIEWVTELQEDWQKKPISAEWYVLLSRWMNTKGQYKSALLACDLHMRYNVLGIIDGHGNYTQLEKAEKQDVIRAEASFGIIYKFLSFLSCTNIRAVDVVPSQKLQVSRRKKDKLPLISYKILELFQKKLRGTKEGQSLWTNRIHLCRGHMAEYGVDGKGLLFGKYAGRFWIPPHVKGDKKQGVVIKDYQLTYD